MASGAITCRRVTDGMIRRGGRRRKIVPCGYGRAMTCLTSSDPLLCMDMIFNPDFSMFFTVRRLILGPISERTIGLKKSMTLPRGRGFRHKIFKFLLSKGKITEELVDMVMKWRHSGFNRFSGLIPRSLLREKYRLEVVDTP